MEEAAMDWNAAIERNREALKRVLAMLVAMAGSAGGSAFTSPLCGLRGRSSDRASGSIVGRKGRGDCEAIGVPGKIREASGGGDDPAITPTRRSDDRRPPHKGEVESRPTLPRHLHRAVLRLLRPAEAAVRRLVIVMARGLVAKLPPARPRQPQPKPTVLRNGVGTGILMPRGYRGPLTPPLKGEGVVNAASGLATNSIGANASEYPSPLRGGVRGGGKEPSARRVAFQLLDPLPRWNRRARPAARGVPRISVPGFTVPHPVAVRQPPSPDDPVDAARLALRLAALASALDDLPGQARRFARWRARRDAANALARQGRPTGRSCRFSPLRPGRPPGGRRRPTHEVHEVLKDLQWFAVKALERTDTS
jgi:hypothetical protein